MSSASEPSIPKCVFKRCARDYLDTTGRKKIAISKDALDILQQDVESRLVEVYTDAFQMSVEAKRQTLKLEDFQAALDKFKQANNDYRPGDVEEDEDGGV